MLMSEQSIPYHVGNCRRMEWNTERVGKKILQKKSFCGEGELNERRSSVFDVPFGAVVLNLV